jgi:hypothetical protein
MDGAKPQQGSAQWVISPLRCDYRPAQVFSLTCSAGTTGRSEFKLPPKSIALHHADPLLFHLGIWFGFFPHHIYQQLVYKSTYIQ